MGWGFRKSVKIAPGIRVNFSKSGISTSIGGKGFTYNTRGRVTTSIPGTGMRYTHSLKDAKRTSSPVSAVIAGSRNLGSDGFERLSKREQATRDFVVMVKTRTTTALVNYFFSHGVYVQTEDLSEAVTLEDHQDFLESLSREFETTTNAIRLAVDIGSISLAEKEKAMRAVYEIERKCAEHQGSTRELSDAASALLAAVRSYPVAPSFVGPFVTGLFGAFLTSVVNIIAGLVVTAVAFLYGGGKTFGYFRERDAAVARIEEQNRHFDSLLVVEVTPRPTLRPIRDTVKPKAIAFAAAVFAATLAACAVHLSAPQRPAADSAASSAQPTTGGADRPAAADNGTLPANKFAWMVGKPPYEVVNDRRFKAVFRGVTRESWKKVSDRLMVAGQSGITVEDGFLVGEGCKAHQCGSEKAAFAINESTGKGVLMMMETPGDTPVFTTYGAVNQPVEQTPLANWKQQQIDESPSSVHPSPAQGSATAAFSPTYPTSFNCSQARSDAERLICSDPILAAADVELAATYTKAKAAVTDQAAFRERTRAQWNYRERACHDRECLARWYADQKNVLDEIAETGVVGP
ncbi:hypothetical protein VI03_16665 [Burkholderia vietnamiensis]|uniref:DUF4236 domain-containing protein n=1 Tax=Burkholderia vietnamiensis TaxID=60552 RepID=A0AAW7SWK2_BURVI|nr:DUF4236 domain-containing protein [Burkholderia vietnamiensis]KKI37634.1 hypothetical protein VI03_16665 [Burkholderia vietnamiensis]MBR8005049.1 DUF4236 domain-containing protein [Burkholderia vietnamiensis]MDN7793689.1 DUF4236 domain-containing protein [Burkholderia vietnamiensis]HDR9188152.1 DUF4236 domain-containing protein [Burkholderia vietnamiensis]